MSVRHNIVIFGASGFIGGNLLRYFKQRPEYRVFPFSISNADLTKPACLPFIISKLKRTAGFTMIIAAAVKHSALSPARTLRGNIAIALQAARLISRLACAQVIFISSIDVYGHHHLKLPLSESSPLQPPNAYALSKLISELILAQAGRRKKTPLAALRLPGVYGPGDKSKRIIPSIFKALASGEKMTISGDGKQRRDLLYAGDLARLVEGLIRHPLAGVFNAVTGQAYALNEIIGLAEKITGRKLKRKYARNAAKQSDLFFKPALILKRLPGFAFTPLPEGLRLTRLAQDVRVTR